MFSVSLLCCAAASVLVITLQVLRHCNSMLCSYPSMARRDKHYVTYTAVHVLLSVVTQRGTCQGLSTECLHAVPELRTQNSQRTFTGEVAAAEHDMNLWR